MRKQHTTVRCSIFVLFAITLSSGFSQVSSTRSKSTFPRSASPMRTTVTHNNRLKQKHKLDDPSAGLALRGGDHSPATKLHAAAAPPVVFRNAPFVQSSAIMLLANGLGLIISLLTGSHLHLDLIGTGAFAAAGLTALAGEDAGIVDRVQLSAGMMTVWGAKLAGFLFFRALQVGNDGRLESTLSTKIGTASFWIASLVWGIFTSLPHTLGATSSAPGTPLTTQLGVVLYGIGLTFETLADVQKYRFKQTNPGKFCNAGVWSLSQHPNWFGNLALWSGIFLLNAPALIEPARGGASPLSFWDRLWSARRFLAALACPLFLWALFSGQANGTISSSLEMANKKYGSDPAYREYVENVPLIIPNPFKWLTTKKSS